MMIYAWKTNQVFMGILLRTHHTRDGKWVKEGISVLKGESATVDQWLAVVHEAVIVTKALEYFGVDETSGAEPAAG